MAKKIMVTPGSNRNEAFNNLVLPRCCDLVLAIGHRMAYEAAEASDLVSTEMLNLFEAACMVKDPSWYVHHKRFSPTRIHKRHAEATSALLPQLDILLQQTSAAPWATAPILWDQDWEDFLDGLPSFSHGESTPTATLSGSSTPLSGMTIQQQWVGEDKDLEIIAKTHSIKEERCHQKAKIPTEIDRPRLKRRKWHWLVRLIH